MTDTTRVYRATLPALGLVNVERTGRVTIDGDELFAPALEDLAAGVLRAAHIARNNKRALRRLRRPAAAIPRLDELADY